MTLENLVLELSNPGLPDLGSAPSTDTYGLGGGLPSDAAFNLAATSNLPDSGSDVNGNGAVDLLWYNTATGQLNVWFMNNTTFQGDSVIAQMPPEWQVAGVADFNDDGDADLLWQNANTGEVYVWTLNNGAIVGFEFLTQMPLEWEITGTGDFTSDGDADLLWRNSNTGELFLWAMDGTSVIGFQSLTVLDNSWQVATTGDFNSDNLTDLVWQNQNSGEVYIWTRSPNAGFFWNASYITALPTDWKITGSGDFNGDQKTDLLWHNQNSGATYVWYMNDLAPADFEPVTTVDPAWIPLSSDRGGLPDPSQANPAYDFDFNGFSSSSFTIDAEFNIAILNVLESAPEPGIYIDVVNDFTIDYTVLLDDTVGQGLRIDPEATILTVTNTALAASSISASLEIDGDFIFIDTSEFNEGLIPLSFTISFDDAAIYRITATDTSSEVGSTPVGSISGELQIGFSQPASLDGQTMAFIRFVYPDTPENQAALTLAILNDDGDPSAFNLNSFNQEVGVVLSEAAG